MSKDTIHLFNNLSVKGLIANGQIGTAGQTLSSNGTAAFWSDTTGYTGSAGTNGYTGSQGVLGYHGSTGYAGSAGTNGYTGSIGYTGSQGILGYHGSTGYTGSQGLLGYHGSTGFTGSAGTNGYTGSIGYTGSWGGTAQANVNMNGYSINSANVINAVDVNVSGNLVVSGATTTVNTTNLDVFDAIVRLNRGQATPLNDIGILMQRYATADSTNYNVGFAWDEGTDRLIFGTTPESGSDNDLSFASEWMTIAANGNVGIGSASPTNKLDIAAAGTINARIQNTANTQDAYFTAQNTLGSALFGMNATGQYLYTLADVPLLFYNNGTEKMRIANTGSIAIGTNSPGDFGSTTVTVDAFKSGGALFRARGTNVDAIMQASDVNSAMFIGTRGAHSVVLQANNTESMRIIANGNIGIGTQSPTVKMEVAGDILITSENIGLRTRFISGKASPANTAGPLYLQYNSNDFVQIGGGTGSANLNIASGSLIVSNSGPGSATITISTANSSANGGVGTELLKARIYSPQDMAMVSGQRLYFRGAGGAWSTPFSFSTDTPFNQVAAAGDHVVISTTDARSNATSSGIMSGLFSNYTVNTATGASATLVAMVVRSSWAEQTWAGTANNAMLYAGQSGGTLVYRVNKNGDIWTAGSLNVTTTSNFGNTTITGFANVTSTIQGGSSLAIAGALSGVTTAAMGNTTITGFANVSTTLQVTGAATFNDHIYLGTNARYIYGKMSNGTTNNRLLGINSANDVYIGAIDSPVTSTIINAGGGASPLYIYANNIVSASFVANGNVGISNTAPTHKLSVNGTTYLQANATIATDSIFIAGRVDTDRVLMNPKYIGYVSTFPDPATSSGRWLLLGSYLTGASGLGAVRIQGNIDIVRGSTGAANRPARIKVDITAAYATGVVADVKLEYGPTFCVTPKLYTVTYGGFTYYAIDIYQIANSATVLDATASYFTGVFTDQAASGALAFPTLVSHTTVSGVTEVPLTSRVFNDLYTTSNGYFGIGNTAPTDKLSVNGSTYLGGITTFAANVVLGSVGVSANGGFGTAGHVLHSNGSATYWAADDGVTNIATANGLSGGPITSTGTIGVTTGSTLTVNNSGIHVNSALSITSLTLAGALSGVTTLAAGNTTITGFANVVSGNIHLSSGYDIVSPDNFAIYDSTNTRDRFTFSTSNLYDTRAGGAHIFKIAGANVANITGNTVLFTPTIGTLASTDDALEVYPTVLASSHEVRNFVRLVDTYNAGVNGQAFYIKSLTNGAHYGGWMMNATWGQSIRFGSASGGADAANNIPTAYAEVSATSLSTTGLTFSTGNTTITGFANISTTVNAASFTIGSTMIANTSGITTTVGASAISFTNTTSNWITWNASGVGAPTATTRSAGTKLVVYPAIAAGSVDYGIGIESSHLWFSAASTTAGFKWYSNTTNIMTLNTTELNLNTRALTGVTTANVTTLNISSSAVIANSSVIRISSNTNIIQDPANGTGSIAGVIGYNPEGSLGVHPFLTNDIANLRLRGATLGANTNVPLSNANFDAFFDSTPTYAAGFANNTANTVLEFVNVPTLLYGSKVGISFGSTAWAPTSVVIEAFSEGAWVTCYSNTAFNLEQVVANIPGNAAVGTNALRFTLGATVATTRVAHIFAYDYNSDGWSHAAMPRAGGQFYGNVSVNSTSQFAVGTTVINATSFTGTANNATYLNGQLAAYYTNATNITTGTLPYAQIPANVVNTTAAFTRTGVTTFSANVIIGTSGFSANGTYGLAGEVLRSNGTSAYWGSAGGIGTVTSVGSGNGLTGGPIESSGTLSVVANTGIVANATGVFVNASYIATISANNATYLNGQLASYYTNATNITTGTLPYAQIPANVVNTTAAFTISGTHTHTSPIIIRTTGSSQNGLEVSNSSVGIFLVANTSSGVYNGLVGSGDNLIYVSNNTINNGNLVIGSWTDRAVGFGIKLTTSTYNVNVVANTFTVSSNVGIGTSTPTFRLQVETDTDANAGTFIRNSNTGTSATGTLTVASPVGNILMRAHSAAHSAWPNSTMVQSDSGFTGGLNIVQAGANPIKLWTNGTERIRIDSGGNIGIGNNAPASRLHVSGTGFIFNNANADPAGGISIPNAAGTFITYNRSAGLVDTEIIYGNTVNSFFRLTSQSAAGVLNERMRVDSAGNVGIGTTSPQQKFVVSDAGAGGIEIIPTGVIQSYNRSTSAYQALNIDANIIAFRIGVSEKMRLTAAGELLVNRTSTSGYGKLNVDGGADFTGGNVLLCRDSGNVGVGTASPGYKLEVNGSFAATTKSFVIDHPTKPDMKLRYGSLEGPENGVYVRGKLKDFNIIVLPDYWVGLVDEDSITVNLTPIGKHQKIYVEEIKNNCVHIGNDNLLGKNIECFYTVYAERKDVEKIIVEY